MVDLRLFEQEKVKEKYLVLAYNCHLTVVFFSEDERFCTKICSGVTMTPLMYFVYKTVLSEIGKMVYNSILYIFE